MASQPLSFGATRSIVSWIGLASATASGSGDSSSSSSSNNGGGVLDLQLGGRRGRFVFHRAIRLEELTVVGSVEGRSGGGCHALEILSPDKSFAVVAGASALHLFGRHVLRR
jgi:hypothetical protein